MIEYFLYSQNYIFWIMAIILAIFVLWLFFGGGNYEFVGLNPLQTNQKVSPYITSHKYSNGTSFAKTAEDMWSDSTEDGFLPSKDFNCVDDTPSLPYGFISDGLDVCNPSKVKTPRSKKYESKGERKCREVMEQLYNVKFPKVRPQFLRNPETGYLLELDCYSENLGLAVEYNGSQHYVWPNYTNQSHENFIKQRRRDQLKVDLCDLNGVYLISVPYNVKLDQIEEYIVHYLPQNVQQRLLDDIQYANDN